MEKMDGGVFTGPRIGRAGATECHGRVSPRVNTSMVKWPIMRRLGRKKENQHATHDLWEKRGEEKQTGGCGGQRVVEGYP